MVMEESSMDELDLIIKEACNIIAEEEIRKWEELAAAEPVELSERYRSRIEETFPFLKHDDE